MGEEIKEKTEKTKKLKLNKVRLWQGISGILLVILLILFFSGGFGNNRAISKEKVSTNIVNYLNAQTGGGVNYVYSEDIGSLYKITVSYEGQNIPVYATKDGKYFMQDISLLDPQPSQITQTQPKTQPTPSQTNQKISVDEDKIKNAPYLGDTNALVTIIDFSDYSCPFCARHYIETKPLIKSNYIEKGLVRYIWMDFISVGTSTPHEAALCVRELKGDGAFWEMNGLILENQQEVRSNPNKLSELAVQAGADETSFNECFNSEKYAAQIQESTRFGRTLGITGTPGFLIGNSEQGYELVSGAYPYQTFEQIVGGLLK